MRARAASTATALAAALLLAPVLASAGQRTATRVGHATDPSTGAALYSEVHHETFSGGHMVADHVVYVDPKGHPFAEKQVDFGADPLLPDFLLRNRRTGQVEGAARAPGGLLVRFRERRGDSLEKEIVKPPSHGAVDDAGFDRFIDRRFDALAHGKVMRVSFLIPSRHEFFNFRIRRDDGGGGGPGTIDFVMEPDSMLLRLFASPIRVRYDRATRRLLRYDGVSNLRDANGDNPHVLIHFRYGNLAANPAP